MPRVIHPNPREHSLYSPLTAPVGLKRKSLLLGQNEGSTTCQKKNRRFSGEPYRGENHGNVEMSWHKKEGNVGPLTNSFSQDAQAF